MSPATAHRATTGRAPLAEIVFWLVLAAGFWLWPSYLPLASQVLIAGLFALSFDLVLGYAGIVSLGHAAYFGRCLCGRSAVQTGMGRAFLGTAFCRLVRGRDRVSHE